MLTGPLRVDSRELAGAAVVEPCGVLDVASYAELRDALLKTSVDEPRAMIVDVDELAMPDRTALVLFPAVAAQVSQWPGLPLLLAATKPTQHEQLATYRLSKYVPVHRSVPAALAAIDEPPPRRIARRKLPNSLSSSALARRWVLDVCSHWPVAQRGPEAMMVANELVENTLLHTYCAPSLRLELRRGLLTVAVYDDDPAPARPVEPPSPDHRGLELVARLTRTWGSSPAPGGGKVVWAVLLV
ncbi:MAG: ATP-binding protein [Actinophytocola sp.]|uniref:ATP-binding protein n=1 Tax=Actinophytocola sp. TaxID=1872138 RepID=UPI003D6B03B5